ncbi:ABC transporter substrate-binding protein [Paenibacillus sp. GYB003]|uniref:ABC transporter substrate-binding protein n=1 Tax=Paenibacillus sp. GYB003 TaxID=2994392 RepID=UPI002F9655BF
MKTRAYWAAAMAALVALTAGCGGHTAAPGSGKQDVGQAPKEDTGPFKLTMFKEDNGVSAETIEQIIRQKFPQIELKLIKSGKGSMIEDVVASGEIPDLLSFSLGGLWKLKDLQLLSDLTPFIETTKFDLNRFESGIVDTVKSYSDDGTKFLVMPFELNNNALFYNKDIFDKAGVAYPKDGMTWDDVYDLAKRLVRTDGNVQIHGFHYNFLNLIYKNQLALPFVDPKTNKAAVANERWAYWTKVMTSFYTIPGNQPPVDEKTAFLKNQNLAMRTGPNYVTELAASGMNWDVAALPRFAGEQQSGSQMNAPYYAVPPAGKNKEAAYRVLTYLMSDEVMIQLARQGRIPVMKNEAVRKEFAKGIPGLENKNMAAFFKDTIAKPSPQTKYDGAAKSAMNATVVSLLGGTKDINTALRELEEQINKQIEQEMRR